MVLRAGEDFDDLVLATSLGIVPRVCGELIDALAALARDGRPRGNRAHPVAAALAAQA